jgi:hypothetical protein
MRTTRHCPLQALGLLAALAAGLLIVPLAHAGAHALADHGEAPGDPFAECPVCAAPTGPPAGTAEASDGVPPASLLHVGVLAPRVELRPIGPWEAGPAPRGPPETNAPLPLAA